MCLCDNTIDKELVNSREQEVCEKPEREGGIETVHSTYL